MESVINEKKRDTKRNEGIKKIKISYYSYESTCVSFSSIFQMIYTNKGKLVLFSLSAAVLEMNYGTSMSRFVRE